MHGRTSFPRIGPQPYGLTLGPYACYWFELQRSPIEVTPIPTPVAAADPTADLVASLPALLVGTDWDGVFESATRDLIEQRALVPFLRRQRWFGQDGARGAQGSLLGLGASQGRPGAGLPDHRLGGLRGRRGRDLLGAPRLPHRCRCVACPRRTVRRRFSRASRARARACSWTACCDDDVCDRLLALTDRGPDVVTVRGTVKGVAGRAERPARQGGARPMAAPGSPEQRGVAARSPDAEALSPHRARSAPGG